ncbi:MAG: dCTP deaminase [bacterium]|nr:dCTP deaminase [bacterium]
MVVKPDRWIKEMGEKMITPFSPEKVKKGISFGVSSYGYDFILFDEFLIFKGKGPVSPKNLKESDFEKFKGNICTIPPNSFVLGRSAEYFRIPRNVIGICFGKSTYARCGVIVNVTPLEPEWEGHITVQIANLTPVKAEIYAGEGIAQVIFLSAEKECEKSYKDAAGKYQESKGIILSR